MKLKKNFRMNNQEEKQMVKIKPKRKKIKMTIIQKLKLTTKIILSVIFISCEDNNQDNTGLLEFDIRLPQDENGYYSLTLDRDKWQTLHRVTAKVSDTFYLDNFYISWESNLYWMLNDTLGYIVKRQFSDWNGSYVSTDTSYITGFNGMEVPTTNRSSYSNRLGEINNMIAPVKNMVGDTLMLGAFWSGGEAFFGIVLK
tara:strand:+ start:815 stop:1411 length:597 start_codon:yes stop_codon:yes gene_type:complete